MKRNDTFICYSIRLSAFLILKGQKPYRIAKDEDGEYIFYFPDRIMCEQLLREYQRIGGIMR